MIILKKALLAVVFTALLCSCVDEDKYEREQYELCKQCEPFYWSDGTMYKLCVEEYCVDGYKIKFEVFADVD